MKREAVPRNRRDVVPLTPTTLQKLRRHLVPLLPLLKSLDANLVMPDVSCSNRLKHTTAAQGHLPKTISHSVTILLKTVSHSVTRKTINDAIFYSATPNLSAQQPHTQSIAHFLNLCKSTTVFSGGVGGLPPVIGATILGETSVSTMKRDIGMANYEKQGKQEGAYPIPISL